MISGYRFYHQYLSPYLAEPKKKDYTFLILTFASLIILGFAIRPTFASLFSSSLKIWKGKAQEQILKEKIETLKKAEENYQRVEGSLDLLEEALPSEKNLSLLLEEISFILGKNNLALGEVYFKKPVVHTDSDFLALPFSIKAQGQYTDCEKALFDFENSLHQKDFESIKISLQKGGDLEITFNLKTYYHLLK